MNTIALYDKVCHKASRHTTYSYSTSFSLGIRSLDKRFHAPIHAIYGFVRFADEIVDTFHGFDKDGLLARFREDTYRAIAEGISLNPILHSFQRVVSDYRIEQELYDTFLDSMAMDLTDTAHDQRSYETYILGSAEVVGLIDDHHIGVAQGQGQIAGSLAPALQVGVVDDHQVGEITEQFRQVASQTGFPDWLTAGLGHDEQHLLALKLDQALDQHQQA